MKDPRSIDAAENAKCGKMVDTAVVVDVSRMFTRATTESVSWPGSEMRQAKTLTAAASDSRRRQVSRLTNVARLSLRMTGVYSAARANLLSCERAVSLEPNDLAVETAVTRSVRFSGLDVDVLWAIVFCEHTARRQAVAWWERRPMYRLRSWHVNEQRADARRKIVAESPFCVTGLRG